MVKRTAFMAALLLAFVPARAHADWLFTPLVGGAFGADTFGTERSFYGAAFTWRDEEAFGWEAEFSLAPDFFEGVSDGRSTFDGSGHVMTIMGNVVIGLTEFTRVQPYVTGGVGLLQMRVISDRGTFETTTHEPGFNIGAGAFLFTTDRVAVRGDLRYVRSFRNQAPSWTRGTELDVAPGNFDFWRAGVGVSLRFGE
jgi:opacity protein-like surface antigen